MVATVNRVKEVNLAREDTVTIIMITVNPVKVPKVGAMEKENLAKENPAKDIVVHLAALAGVVTEKVNPAKDTAIHLVAGAAMEKVNPAKDIAIHLVAGAAMEKVNPAKDTV